MTELNLRHYRSGYAAALSGKSVDDCPFLMWDGWSYEHWMAGYLAGRDARALKPAA